MVNEIEVASFKDLPIPRRGLWNEDNFSPSHNVGPESAPGSIGGSIFKNHISILSDRGGVHTAASSQGKRPNGRSSLFGAVKIRAVTNHGNHATARDRRKSNF